MKSLGSMLTPDWLGLCSRLREILINARRAGLDLRFRLPPKEIVVLVPFEALIDSIACNDDSRMVGRALAMATDAGCAASATVFMLHVALEAAGVPFERVPLHEMGLVEEPQDRPRSRMGA